MTGQLGPLIDSTKAKMLVVKAKPLVVNDRPNATYLAVQAKPWAFQACTAYPPMSQLLPQLHLLW